LGEQRGHLRFPLERFFRHSTYRTFRAQSNGKYGRIIRHSCRGDASSAAFPRGQVPLTRRRLHDLAEMEAGMRRLVVADGRPRDARPVLRVVYERRDAVRPRAPPPGTWR
jgi:hypothetical protein